VFFARNAARGVTFLRVCFRLYLTSIVLFPPESSLDEFVNYKTHYYSNHRVFFVPFAIFSPLDLVDTLLKRISNLSLWDRFTSSAASSFSPD
jgi:hypothetical protein